MKKYDVPDFCCPFTARFYTSHKQSKKSMKTAIQWFAFLPDLIRQKAILNTPNEKLYYLYESLSEAICCAFIWRNTTEGYSYWDDIYLRAKCGEFACAENTINL